ncbi:MAG: glycosyl transferase [Desulfobulbaceae bacterium A2]|nr:MAG: glycosyl transferase [Desulfobulbaceae bacterium A2]
MKITAIILTYNEEVHIARCLKSVSLVTDNIIVVDCFSQDNTLSIARQYGTRILQHEWVSASRQFNWALAQLEPSTDWVLRLDADEYLSPELVEEIRTRLPELAADIAGVSCGRRMKFQGQLIRYGGVFPVKIIRLFRLGQGRCENRWMDEHILVNGNAVGFSGEIIDDNKNSMTWWIDKHNHYASWEAVELLNLQFGFMPRDSGTSLTLVREARAKRWIKENIYARLPGCLRAFLYFVYRYVLRLGFLDGEIGLAFHFFQGFWYRYLVDAKVAEVRRYMRQHNVSVIQAIDDVLQCNPSGYTT